MNHVALLLRSNQVHFTASIGDGKGSTVTSAHNNVAYEDILYGTVKYCTFTALLYSYSISRFARYHTILENERGSKGCALRLDNCHYSDDPLKATQPLAFKVS